MAQKKNNRFAKTVTIKNKRASFDYEFIDTYTAGISLQGTEIKSIREGKATIAEGHCAFKGEELFLFNATISPYEQGNIYNHDPLRPRKLLLNRKELVRLQDKVEEKGLTIVPVRLFINDNGLAKLFLALARGKKTHDKRDSIKERDVKRELSRIKF